MRTSQCVLCLSDSIVPHTRHHWRVTRAHTPTPTHTRARTDGHWRHQHQPGALRAVEPALRRAHRDAGAPARPPGLNARLCGAAVGRAGACWRCRSCGVARAGATRAQPVLCSARLHSNTRVGAACCVRTPLLALPLLLRFDPAPFAMTPQVPWHMRTHAHMHTCMNTGAGAGRG
jgi:hypothetical protein